MAMRRQADGGCGVVANVLHAFVLFVAASFAACDDRGGAGSRPDDSGALGGDEGGGGAGGASGQTISCSASGDGCLCLIGDPQPGQITACDPVSVARGEAERGVCCVTQSLCTCVPYTCRSDPASSFCQCGSVPTLATVTLGTAVAECPAPTAQQKCCFSQDNASCICSGLACAVEETQVSNCSATAAGACLAGEDIAACR
jgi:hypothetical protein